MKRVTLLFSFGLFVSLSLEKPFLESLMTYFARVFQTLNGKGARPVYRRSWARFPSGTQIFSFSHARAQTEYSTFISSLSLKFTFFLYLLKLDLICWNFTVTDLHNLSLN